jgi:predicted PolB exonuclease-like 3'-5' exonuclease
MRSEQVRDISRVLFLDIETVPQAANWSGLDERMRQLFSDKTRFEQERNGKTAEQVYGERAGIFAEFGKIICIGVGTVRLEKDPALLRVTTLHGDDEKDVLLRFCELLNKHYNTDDHWLCGHNGREFDFPWLARRCVVHGIRLPKLLDIGGLKPWEVGHLDTMQLWKFGDHKAFTSLDLLTHILGIPSPKTEMKGSDVARVYYEEQGLERIAQYCKRDVVATAQLYMRLRGEALIPEPNIALV